MAEVINLQREAEKFTGQRQVLTEHAWEERRQALIEYVLKNPDAKRTMLEAEGHIPTLNKHYKGCLTDLKRSLGIQPELTGDGLAEGIWDRRKENLLAYIKNHPESTSRSLLEAGYWTTVMKFYNGRINDLRKAAGMEPKPRGRGYSIS